MTESEYTRLSPIVFVRSIMDAMSFRSIEHKDVGVTAATMLYAFFPVEIVPRNVARVPCNTNESGVYDISDDVILWPHPWPAKRTNNDMGSTCIE